MAEAEIASPPSLRQLLWLTGSAALAGAAFVLVGVLPAEYNRDPTGLGRLTGISNLWAPEEKMVSTNGADGKAAPATRSYATPYRSDVVEIPLGSGDDPFGSALEYKVRLKAGGSYIYSWSVDGAPNDEFYSEFHGHTVEEGKTMTVAEYRKEIGASDNGVLTAPFDGVHGWYFQNQSVNPVKVKLRLSGFYELIPDGQPGNEAGIHAKQVN